MTKCISIVVFLCYSFMIIGNAFPTDSANRFMKINNIIDKIHFQGSKGSINGVQNEMIYKISQGGINIGYAKVIAVQEETSIFYLLELKSSWELQKGYHLRLCGLSESELFKKKSSKFSVEALVEGSDTDYYLLGKSKGDDDYNGVGAFIGGYIVGTLLGLIGWGIGYLVTSGQDVKVPYNYTSSFDFQAKNAFNAGYTDIIKKKRITRYHSGAAAGIFTAVLLVTILTSGK